MKFIDLFAGAGGFSLGFEMAGAECLAMVERDEWAFNTYQMNRPHSSTIALNADVKSVNVKTIAKQLRDAPDVIIGGPPCQGFSNAADIRNFYDSRNDLFHHFFEWVDIFKPKIFVMENVLGLISKKDKLGNLYKELILEKFRSIGYDVTMWTLNAMDYGVPQQRLRIFFVGTNIKGKNINQPVVTHSKTESSLLMPVTVGEAIGDLPLLKAGEGEEIREYASAATHEYQKWARQNSLKIYNHVAMKHTDRLVERYKMIQEGTRFAELPEDLKVRKRGDASNLSQIQFGLNYRLLHGDRVSLTIPASFYSSFIHPFQPRNITTREAARLQSFPDSYFFYGKRTLVSNSMLIKKGITPTLSQYNQVGNAVPPLLAKAIAETLRAYLEEVFTPQTEHVVVS